MVDGQPVQLASHVINQIKLAGIILAEAHDAETGIDEFPPILRPFLFVVVTECPDLAGVVVAVDIVALQLWKPRTVINDTAGDRAKLGVIVFHHGWQNGAWTARSFGTEWMASFGYAPTVVPAAF